MGKRIRHVRAVQDVEGAGGLCCVEKQFGECNGGDAIAGVVLAQRLAYGKGACTLPVPHEHPCGRQEELSLVCFHLSVIFPVASP